MFNFFKRFLSATGVQGQISGAGRKTSTNFFSSNSDTASVTEESALNHATVQACVRLLADAVAGLTLKAYRDGEEVDHPFLQVFNRKPNSYQSGFEVKELVMLNLLIRGNAFINLDNGVYSTKLSIIMPDKVRVDFGKLQKDKVSYIVTADGLGDVVVKSDKMIHVKNLSLDGLNGLSPIQLARTAIDIAASAERYGKRFFDNDGSPLGLLKNPLPMSDEAKQAMATAWKDKFGGSNKKGGTAILDEGMSYEKVMVNNTDAQFLQSREFQSREIAKAYGIPVALLEPQPGASIEALMAHVYKTTVAAWCRRIEQAINAFFFEAFPDTDFEFDMEEALRGDVGTRYSAYATALRNFMTVNEIRELEGLKPVENGDELLQPLNMAPLGFDINATNAAENTVNAAKGEVNVSQKGTQDAPDMPEQDAMEQEPRNYAENVLRGWEQREKKALQNIFESSTTVDSLTKKLDIFFQRQRLGVERVFEFDPKTHENVIETAKKLSEKIQNACKTDEFYDNVKLNSFFSQDLTKAILDHK